MDVLRDSPAIRQRYQQLLASDDAASVYHTLEWLDLFRVLGWEVIFVEASPTALVPFLTRGFGPFRRAFSLPYDTYGGVVGQGRGIAGRDVLDAVRVPTARIVDFSGRVEGRGCNVEQVTTHVVDLSVGYDEVWGAYSRSQQKAVRQAADRGVEVRVVESDESVRSFYRLYSGLVSGHGLRPIPFAFFDAMRQTMVPVGTARYYEASVGGTIAGGLVLTHNGEAHAWMTGYDESALASRPVNAVFDQAIKDEIEAGSHSFNLGTSPTGGTGILRFKEAFGGRERTYSVLCKKGRLFELAAYFSNRRRATRG